MAANEGEIQLRLQELQKQLAKKQMFEGSVSEIRSLLQHHYSSASPNLRKTVRPSDFFFPPFCVVVVELELGD